MHLFKVYFDGGDSGQWAYGSWEIVFNGFIKRVHRKSFADYRTADGKSATSNVAEYLSLIDALEWLQSVKNQDQYTVHIHGDSMLVIKQLSGSWVCRCLHLRRLRYEVLALLRGFKSYSATWHPRKNSVNRFGH